MSDFIHFELQIEILAWLPAEDLIRYRTVCKSWYSLITSHSFISLHTRNQTNNGNNLLLVRSGISPRLANCSIRFDNDNLELYKSFDFLRSHSRIQYLKVNGCSNGVVCLSDHYIREDAIVLWNPTIRKSITLPKRHYDHSVGFAYCGVSNDYKVVRVFLRDDKITVGVEVFDLSKGCWRSVDPKGFRYISSFRCPQAYLNGAVHWSGHKQDDIHSNIIVSFDMGTEKLGVIPLPNTVAAHPCSSRACFRVSVLGESLCLIEHQSIWCKSDVCEIWVMKKYGEPESWTKLFTFDFGRHLRGAFGFLKNGEVLLVHRSMTMEVDEFRRWRGHELVAYDPESKQVKHLGIRGDSQGFYVGNFVETLALLGVQGARSV